MEGSVVVEKAKEIKPGVYTQEVDLSYILLCSGLDAFINSFIPKMFYNVQYNKSPEKFCISVPRVMISEIGKRIKKEVEDLVWWTPQDPRTPFHIEIEIKSNENFD